MTTWRRQKRRYRQYQARKEQLPTSHRAAIDAVEHYALRFGPDTGETVVTMLEDLVEIFEHAAVAGTAAADVVGTDPVAFAETLLRRYPTGRWVEREQRRLGDSVAGCAVGDASPRAEG